MAAFSVLATGHLVAQLVGSEGFAGVSQVLLVPPLVGYVALTRSPVRRSLMLALGWCWLGDTVPRFLSGDAGFLAMVGCFLVAQVVFVRIFWPDRGSSVLAAGQRGWLAPYVVVFVLLLVLCAPGAGVLLPAVLIYGGCLTAMAVLATGVSRLVTAGGVLFLVSDGLIALGAFAPGFDSLPYGGFWVMLTYTLAVLLLTVGVSGRRSPDASL